MLMSDGETHAFLQLNVHGFQEQTPQHLFNHLWWVTSHLIQSNLIYIPEYSNYSESWLTEGKAQHWDGALGTDVWASLTIYMDGLYRLFENFLYLSRWQLFFMLFSGRRESGSFWLTATSSVKKEGNFEVKACNPNPLIQRHLQPERARGSEYGWDCIMHLHKHKHTFTYMCVLQRTVTLYRDTNAMHAND